MATPAPAPAELVDDLVEEILLRCPPEDPARLLRAALVCKRWCRLVAGPGFRRRFREFHRTAPMLGFLYHRRCPLRFEPTSSFRPPRVDRGICSWRALDARHGRVLVHRVVPREASLVVWDPVTGARRGLPMPQFEYREWSAAFLCAAAGCDHLDCGCGPFLVVFVGIDELERVVSACVYSSKNSAWSELTSVEHTFYGIHGMDLPSTLVGDALYFPLRSSARMLEYDLGTQGISMVELPPTAYGSHIVPTTTEDGRLGFAMVHKTKLFLWLREAHPVSDVEWKESRVIELEALLPAEALLGSPEVVGFASGIGLILLRTVRGFFTIDLKSSHVRGIGDGLSFYDVLPYTSFCTPAFGATLQVREQELMPQVLEKLKVVKCGLLG
ncbi:hypothetical protein ACP70R_014598 [Stipagrostis hirtigluma subsp. patula]